MITCALNLIVQFYNYSFVIGTPAGTPSADVNAPVGRATPSADVNASSPPVGRATPSADVNAPVGPAPSGPSAAAGSADSEL